MIVISWNIKISTNYFSFTTVHILFWCKIICSGLSRFNKHVHLDMKKNLYIFAHTFVRKGIVRMWFFYGSPYKICILYHIHILCCPWKDGGGGEKTDGPMVIAQVKPKYISPLHLPHPTSTKSPEPFLISP